MTNRAFVICAFGDRKNNVQRLVKNIRQYFDYPIRIITSLDSDVGHNSLPQDQNICIQYVERRWPKGSYRADIRNSNYFKIQFALEQDYYSFCLLDDDMSIVNKNFEDGFSIAERFGAAVPMNPRIFVKYNAMGADVSVKDLADLIGTPQFAPACNFSPMFVCPHTGYTTNFLHALLEELDVNVCRGTLAIFKASWKSQVTPVYLPEQWCICASNAEHIKNYTEQLRGQQVCIPPMCLHLGHEQVRKTFGIE